ncbi:MAG: response regulator, partial [Candidatus Falkowbacteria bacterium]
MRKKILIVEDDVLLVKAISYEFEQENFEVFTAGDGVDGLAMAEQHLPDLILADILMPKMDGLVMLKKLRDREGGKKIKFIILTNVNSSDKIAEAMDLQEVVTDGYFEYFIKADIELEEIVKKINALASLSQDMR